MYLIRNVGSVVQIQPPTIMSKIHPVPVNSLGNILIIFQLPTLLSVRTQVDNTK